MIRAIVLRRVLLVLLVPVTNTAYAADCTPWVAKAISIQGNVERRASISQASSSPSLWQAIKRDDTLCAGEIIRVKQNSRAALILINDTILRLNQNTTITLSSLNEDQSHWINLEKGIAHFIARIKQSFKVITPFVNAAVEGTEFVVSVNGTQTVVTVFEGQVNVNNDLGEVTLVNGQTAITTDKSVPTLTLKIKPRDAVQWSLYYPVIINFDSNLIQVSDVNTKAIIEQSVVAARAGHYTLALEQIELISDTDMTASLLSYRAELYLSVGRVEKAIVDIQHVIQLQPENAQAIALQAIIALVQNQKTEALVLAEQAVTLEPKNASTALALSYVHQSLFDIESALQIIKTATTKNKNNALLWSRLSELYLMVGELDDALKAAKHANDLNPNIARTHSALGFAYLARIEVINAHKAFLEAIERDDSDPLSRLGLGLAIIRQGKLSVGRQEIEYAATLDPNNALIRSYLGKVYFEEHRDKLALSQYNMAKFLDPNDPTPYFYNAIRLQRNNQSILALYELDKSIILNKNRSIFRSKLYLDKDYSVKSISRGSVYSDIGFTHYALKNATNALFEDPSNYAAHRFLAELYQSKKKHEIASVSELFQAKMMQPIILNPISPTVTFSGLKATQGFSTTKTGLNEYNSLFENNKINLLYNKIYGGKNTQTTDLSMSTVYDKLSFTTSSYKFKTDGYRVNNQQEQNFINSFLQYQVSSDLNIQFEYKEREFNGGDINQRFGENNFDSNFHKDQKNIYRRFGVNYIINTKNQLYLSRIESYGTLYYRLDDGTQIDTIITNTNGKSTELQYITTAEKYKVISGVGTSSQTGDDLLIIDFGFFDLTVPSNIQIKHDNAYLYVPFKYNDSNSFTFGLSYDAIKQPTNVNKSAINPKFGFINTSKSTTFRLAAFRTLKRPILSEQTLEPTNIAGFNQFFDESNGVIAERYGIGLDELLNRKTRIGIELTHRNIIKYFTINITTLAQKRIKEYLHKSYINYTPNEHLALFFELIYDSFESEYDTSKTNTKTPVTLKTFSIPIGVKYFYKSWLSITLNTTFVNQDVSFSVQNSPLNKFSDSFVVTNLILDFKYNAKIKLLFGVSNVFNEKFQYHNNQSETAFTREIDFYPETFTYANLQFIF